jgi:hypothetical protein
MIFPPLKIWVCLAFVCLGVASGHAATWYAAADGNSTNGTYVSPWSVPFSVAKTNLYLKPGDTVLFKPGGPFVCHDYFSGYDGTNRLGFQISGTPTAKITYRSLDLWGFSFNGNLFLPPTSSNIVLHGFRIFSSDTTNRNRYGLQSTNAYFNTRPYTHPCAIEEFGPGNELLHNLIENCGHGGINSWNTTRGKYIAGNIIRFTGYNDYTGDPAIEVTNWNGARRGSGMYVQNLDDSDEALIAGNIVYFTYTECFFTHCMPSNLWNFNYRNNICVPGTYGLFYDVHDAPSHGIQIVSNYVWAARTGSVDVDVAIGLGTDRNHDGGGTNVIIADNYLAAGNEDFEAVDGWKQLTVTNNTAVLLWSASYNNTPWVPLIWQLGGTQNTNDWIHSYNFDFNTYYTRVQTIYPPFMYFVTNVLNACYFTNWQTAEGEANSTYTVGLPTNVVVNAFAPSTDSNFVHVVVFNWPTNATTTVDLSSYFKAGNTLRIYDAQNIPTAYTNFIYAGGAVALDLTRTNIAEMWGTFTNPPMTWTGFDPRFRAFVIYRYPTRPGNFHVSQ